MYSNIFEIESAIQNLAIGYPARSELITPPNLSHLGNTTSILRIGRYPANAVDGVLLLGGVHAREWIPPDAMLSLAADLLEAEQNGLGLTYGGASYSSEQISALFERLNFFIFPCVNPDGRQHSQTVESLWRKNRRPAPAGLTADSCMGVDLNRNFDFLWDHTNKFAVDSGVSASDDPCNASVYRGPSQASEPETQNVVWMLDTYSRIRWHIDVHSAVPVILHSWGSDQNQVVDPDQNFLNPVFDSVRGRPDDTDYREYLPGTELNTVVSLSSCMNSAIMNVRGTNYGFEQAYSLYPTSGASDDYAYSRQFADPGKTKVYGFTIECGSSFQPAWSEAEEVIREVSSGLICFGLNVHTITDGIDINLLTPSIVFNDVPESETTARAIAWECFGFEDLTFEVVSGPSGPFSMLLGNSVTLPAPGLDDGAKAQLWLNYTGTTTGTIDNSSITVRCVQTGEQWTLAISANTISRPTTAVVLALDKSGSMRFDAGDGRDRIEVLRDAAQIFVDVSKPETGIGIVGFDQDAQTTMPVTEAGPEIFGAGRAQATAAIAAHTPNPSGTTSIGDGAELSASMLSAVSSSYDETAMIVLTDGQENADKFIADVSGSIDDTVFAIGLGEPSAINPEKLSELTNGSDGYVVVTGNISSDDYFSLSKYYLQILAGVSNEEVVLDPQGHLQPADQTDIPFFLTQVDAGCDVILLCPAPQVLDFELVTPNGNVIRANALPSGVQHIVGRGVVYYRFSLPVVHADGTSSMAGRWKVRLHCDRSRFHDYLKKLEGSDIAGFGDTAKHGMRYAVEIHARSAIRLKAQLYQKSVDPGSELHLGARLSELGLPIDRRASVVAEITGPQGPHTVKLKESSPGVFNTSIPVEARGLYRCRLIASGKSLRGERFTREQTLSGAIYQARPAHQEGEPKPGDTKPDVDVDCQKQLLILLDAINNNAVVNRPLDAIVKRRGYSLSEILDCLEKVVSR